MKWASEGGATAVEMLFFRSTIGLPVVLAWIMSSAGIGAIRTKRPRAHLLRGCIGMCGILMNFQALIMLPLADAITIGFSAPIFATILSVLVLREHVGVHRWAAVALGFIGVAIVVRPGGDALPIAGIGVALAGAAGTAAVTITIRQIGGTEQPGAIVFWFFVLSAVVSGIAMPFVAHVRSPETYAILACSAVVGACAQIMMTMSLKAAPVSVVSPFDYGQIVWASLLGWFIFASVPTLNTLAGALLIAGSGLYTAWREHRLHRPAVPATPPIE